MGISLRAFGKDSNSGHLWGNLAGFGREVGRKIYAPIRQILWNIHWTRASVQDLEYGTHGGEKGDNEYSD